SECVTPRFVGSICQREARLGARVSPRKEPGQRPRGDAGQLVRSDVTAAVDVLDEIGGPRLAVDAVVGTLQMVVEIADDLAGKVESRRRHAVVPGARQELPTKIGCSEDDLPGRLVAPVAPEVGGNAGRPDRVEVTVDRHLFPERVASEGRNAVA